MQRRSGPRQPRTGTKRPGRFWTMAVRALAVVAFLLVGHDLLMTSPAGAHQTGVSDPHVHTDDPSMTTTASDSTDAPKSGDPIGRVDQFTRDPDPMQKDSDCGVTREASMPAGQTVSLPGVDQDAVARIPDIAAVISGPSQVRPDARAPTIDARTQRARLQIFRM